MARKPTKYELRAEALVELLTTLIHLCEASDIDTIDAARRRLQKLRTICMDPTRWEDNDTPPRAVRRASLYAATDAFMDELMRDLDKLTTE